ncbi:MAG: hypothetical protein ACK515_10390 [bacterium]
MNDLHRDPNVTGSLTRSYPEFDAQDLHDLHARARAERARHVRQCLRDACALLWRSCAQVWRGVRAGVALSLGGKRGQAGTSVRATTRTVRSGDSTKSQS